MVLPELVGVTDSGDGRGAAPARESALPPRGVPVQLGLAGCGSIFQPHPRLPGPGVAREGAADARVTFELGGSAGVVHRAQPDGQAVPSPKRTSGLWNISSFTLSGRFYSYICLFPSKALFS